MNREAIAKSNASISIPSSRVIVAGGTQGIGEGVALRFARAGAEVWIVGRNEEKANAVLAKLNQISQEQKVQPAPVHHFMKADLSLVAEAIRVAQDIRVRAGERGIDYLIMSQGGPPNGTYKPTSEGIEQHYAVQVLSRFVLAYKLGVEANPVVKKGVMSIAGPGIRRTSVDYDDLEMLSANENGSYGMSKAVTRNSVVLDAMTEESAKRNPSVTFTHVYPGFVKTDFAQNSSLPWLVSTLSKVVFAIKGSTPASYAEVPFYLLANPAGQAVASTTPFWNETVSKVEVVLDEGVRRKIWDHLMSKLGQVAWSKVSESVNAR